MSDHYLSNITKLTQKKIEPCECSAGLGDQDISDIVKTNQILFVVYNYIR